MDNQEEIKSTPPDVTPDATPDINPDTEKRGALTSFPKFNPYWVYGLIAVLLLFNLMFLGSPSSAKRIEWQQLSVLLENRDVKHLYNINKEYVEVVLKAESLAKYPEVAKTRFKGENKGPHFYYYIGDYQNFEKNLVDLQTKASIPVKEQIQAETIVDQRGWIATLLSWIVPFVLLAVIWVFIMRRLAGGVGGAGAQIFNIGRSKATLFDKDTKVNVTFQDVAGLDEAKEEVMEVVDFLRNPKKYTNLGGKIPKGVLLVGPPGTGKTLLAKAVAGEAGVPFFTISGSDFVEMFVGVGASRVRDLFRQAREKAPCIIFIDEIDAIGRSRGRNSVNSNDERENTLNQLLVEMDGFPTDKGVILMAATNRADVLDPALLRPGRFDRQIEIDRPDVAGREQIFRVHLKTIKTSPNIDPTVLAEQTPGFAGADIANVCNESALVAARRNKEAVDMDDFNYALDRVIGGLEKKNKIISPEEKKVIAYHEAGHAICGWFLEHAAPLVKVTIVPRGSATLGFAQYLPKDEYITRTEQLLDRMCMTLGGRAAEAVVFGKISTGAQSDLDTVTKMSYAMIAVYGMNDKVGNVSFYDLQNQNSFMKPYSEQTSLLIDAEVRSMIEAEYLRAQNLLHEHRNDLELLAQELLTKEVLHKADLERLIGPRPYAITQELNVI